jgi:hypothetical protein
MKIWNWYMSDVQAWEQHAQETNNAELLALVKLFKSNRIDALITSFCMICILLLALIIFLER